MTMLTFDNDGQGVHHNGILQEDIGAGDQGFMFGYATGNMGLEH